MSEETQDNELRGRFNTEWDNRIPVAWPNVIFTPPSPKAPYCRFSITNGPDTVQMDIGSALKTFRSTGIVFVQIFIPSNTGDTLALQYGDQAAAIFRNWCGTNIVCRAATVRRIGNTDDGWYQVNVQIPFKRDELL